MSHRICRVYPRMDLGGVENAVLQLLEGIPDTHMVVRYEGHRAPEARAIARRFTALEAPRFPQLLEALQGCTVAHLHAINDHLDFPLAAQLAGCPVILQTVHNQFSPRSCHFVDHSVMVGPTLTDMLATPSRASRIFNGVPCHESLPEREPWHASGRPVVIVEMRRADKDMSCPLEDMVLSGALDGLDFEARVLGFHKDSPDPRLRFMGPQADPYPLLSDADILVHGTAGETYGRTVYEAMACGAIPVATPIRAYTEVFEPDQLLFLPGHDVVPAAHQLRAHIEHLAAFPDHHAAMRRANHAWARQHASVPAMVAHYQALYADLEARGPAYRNLGPTDLEGTDVELFGLLVDQLLDARPPTGLERIEAIEGPAKGILYWLLVDQELVPEPNRKLLLQAAVALLGERHELCLALGRAHLRAGEAPAAAHWLDRATQLDPGNLAPYPELLELLLKHGQAPRALEVLERGCAAVPGYALLEGHRDRLAAALA